MTDSTAEAATPATGGPAKTARRSPNALELHTWRTFIETAEELRSALSGRLQAESGISSGDYAVMLALSEAEGRRLRSSELADHIGWERSRLSHHLGRMEKRGLLVREGCATDNRGAEITLTPVGSDAFRSASSPHLRAIRELFIDALTPEQLAAAGEIAEALQAKLRERAGGA
ncbi:DNA-binding MarR family transcriptional regulator [Diaminobutyricimonas aerilata]|uniref:DNA-binding MarR family transcriptional regulator n=1 Tax=Diaminobutyricimonas aerilata TaxID=1162967 RepID=A0A2M9CF66_9MICO|nr:MarR family transcriptional regulator [Diaminobutyricimonas aerilata]PJJ70502.1 DNA-binding MarR family transcriptional regulator [Diaminobutyricimonas aerilata]